VFFFLNASIDFEIGHASMREDQATLSEDPSLDTHFLMDRIPSEIMAVNCHGSNIL
jgi:hypothetical protein